MTDKQNRQRDNSNLVRVLVAREIYRGLEDDVPARFEVTAAVLALEVIAGARASREFLVGGRERIYKGSSWADNIALGFGGSWGLRFERDHEGRIVLGSLLMKLADRDGVSTAQGMVLRKLGAFLKSYDWQQPPMSFDFAGLIGTFVTVVGNNSPRFYTRRMRAAFRDWFTGEVQEIEDADQANAFFMQWVEQGHEEGVMIPRGTRYGVIRRLVDPNGSFGTRFLVEYDKEGYATAVYWTPTGQKAFIVESAFGGYMVGKGIGDDQYDNWEFRADRRLGVKLRELVEDAKPVISAVNLFEFISSKLAEQNSTVGQAVQAAASQ